MAKNVATAIRDAAHLTAFVDIADNAMAGIDLSPLLMYVIDTAPASALPYLATQLDILGFKGWALANTEEEQRELLKKAIDLHRYKGTPWSIKEALKAVGFGGAQIIEGLAAGGGGYSGIYSYDGSILHDTATLYDWALFSVVVDLGESKGVTEAQTAFAVKLINEYKNARSRLVGLSFTATIVETLQADDDALAYGFGEILDSDALQAIYDGASLHNGAINYAGMQDSLQINVLNAQGQIIQTSTI